ncbi:hypothetical protein K438DRAFT_1867460 [Mycena galopus ATCC 62051]|nr:hypothetical protein K438DRAFT_1867460 [Mycena galopus ATCC 62051]
MARVRRAVMVVREGTANGRPCESGCRVCCAETAIRRIDRRWQSVPRETAARMGGVTVKMPFAHKPVVRLRCIHAASVISMAKYAVGGLRLGAESRTGRIPEVLWTAAWRVDGRDEGQGHEVCGNAICDRMVTS